MLELIQGYSKLSTLLEQYQNAEKSFVDATIQLEALYRMPGDFSKELEQVKFNTNKAIKISKASRDAYLKTISQLTGHTPEELFDLLPELSASIEASQRCVQQEADLKVAYEILVAANSFEEDNPRSNFEDKLTLLRTEKEAALALARQKLELCRNGSDIVVVSEAQASSLLTI